ncbi:MAG: hypothetical protein JXR69_02570 [Candidatus Delongbacteria bacterium]|nr:hypothetical protein [Candidatus Delongbacteria bacterium]
MRKILFYMSLMIFAGNIFASLENIIISPQTIASGNVSGFQTGDTTIPALNTDKKYLSLNFLHPYGITEFSREDVAFQTKVLGKNSYIRVINFGNSTYRENTLQLSSSIFHTDDLTISPGISLFYLHTEFKNSYTAGVDLTAFYKIVDDLEVICSIKNLYAYENDNIDIPMEMFLNFHYRSLNTLDVYLGLEKDDRYKANIKTGISYKPIDAFVLSAGYNFEPKCVNSGFAIRYLKYQFSYAISYHFDLEYSHAVGIVYEI